MDNQKYNVFINFLKERNVYEDFCKNLKNFGSGSVTSFFEYCGEAPIDEDIIAEAFDINDTDEGEEFLSKIDTDGDLIASDEDFKMYSKLAVEYMQKAIDQSKVQ